LVAFAFLAFRFFDWSSRRRSARSTADERGLGVMFDDTVAAFYTLLLIALVKRISADGSRYAQGLARRIGARLKKRHLKLATAESCTALDRAAVTSVAGSSACSSAVS